MYCNHCGTEIPDGSKFCSKCGKTQGTTAAAAMPSTPQATLIVPTVTLDSSMMSLIEILLSVFIIATAFMPWATFESSWIFGFSGSGNLFEIISLIEYESSGWAVFISIICLILAVCHCVAIYSSVVKNSSNYSRHGAAAITTVCLSAVTLIATCILKMQIREEYGPGWDDALKYGVGPLLCLLASICQIITCTRFSRSSEKTTLETGINTVCPHCGTTYKKITAATVCPNCHKLPGDAPVSTPSVTASVQKTNTTTCPFCKRVYPKGTIYCDNCKAQIGVVSTQSPNTKAVFCQQCGTKLTGNALFCSHCGNKL